MPTPKPIRDITTPKNEISTLLNSAGKYASESKAPNTRKAYTSDWADFSEFCQDKKLNPLPANPETVMLYITFLADNGAKYSTIKRRLATISQAHKLKEYDNPINDVVKELLKGIKNTNGTAKNQKAPLMFPEISQLVRLTETDLKGQRDRTMILLGYAGFLRRSELCNLKAEYIDFTDAGLIITLPRTKTGQNEIIAIEFGTFPVYCPVLNLKKWLEKSGIKKGYLFPAIDKGGKIINPEKPISTAGFVKMLKKYCEQIGMNPDQIAGHSLRAGGATQASLNNANDTDIKKHGRWRSDIYHEYIRKADLFKNNPSAKLGL
jgi:site-specific recombinase XerD